MFLLQKNSELSSHDWFEWLKVSVFSRKPGAAPPCLPWGKTWMVMTRTHLAERPSHGGAIFDWQSGSTYWEVANSLWRVGPLGRTVSGWCWVDEFGHGKTTKWMKSLYNLCSVFWSANVKKNHILCSSCCGVCVCVSGFTRVCTRISFDDRRVFDLNKCRRTLDANQHGITWNMLKRLVPLPGGNRCPWPRSSAAVGTDCGITFHAFEEKMADPAVRCWVKNMR